MTLLCSGLGEGQQPTLGYCDLVVNRVPGQCGLIQDLVFTEHSRTTNMSVGKQMRSDRCQLARMPS